MSLLPLAAHLERWFAAEAAHAPGDTRHADACLTFEGARAIADQETTMTPAQTAHVEHCRWCQRCLAAFRLSAPITQSSLVLGHWATDMLTALDAAIREAYAREQGPVVARFDAEGTLRLNWSDVDSPDGPAVVYLQWRNQELPLAQGEVRGGRLEFADPHPALELTNLDIPASVLRVRPVEVCE